MQSKINNTAFRAGAELSELNVIWYTVSRKQIKENIERLFII